MSHPIKDPLPDRLLCDPNGTLSMQDGSDVKSYLASVLALHGITSPIESSLLPRLQAERMREATVHIKQLLDISTKQTTELANLRLALAAEQTKFQEYSAEMVAIVRASKDEAEKAKARLHWLHDCSTGTTDLEGYEWGIYRVKWNCAGQVESIYATDSNFNDLDKEMAREAAARADAARKDAP